MAAHPKPVPVCIRERSWLARLAARQLGCDQVAMVFRRTIHLHNATVDEFFRRPSWVLHELKHVEQYDRLGTLGFLLRYGWESLRRGYRNNRFEVEARASEGDHNLLARYDVSRYDPRARTVLETAASRLSLCPQARLSMPRKIAPTASQKRLFFIHVVIFAVAVIAMFAIHGMQEKKAGTWVYPWHAWPVAAWSLAVIGHWCALWTTYEDKGLDDFNRMVQNG